MGQVTGGGGPSNEIILEANPDFIGDSLAISLSQTPKSTAVWLLKVYCKFSEGGWQQLGSLTTAALSPTQAPSRVVAFACCPGSKGWKVSSTCTTRGEIANIFLSSSKMSFTSVGVVANAPGGA